MTLLLVVLVVDQDLLAWTLKKLFAEENPLYPRASLLSLTWEHLGLVMVSSLAAVVVGVGAGLVLSRPGTRMVRPLGDRLAALGQTFPPAAVLALAVPMVGFGFAPTVWGLFLYGTLPILRGTLTGLDQVSEAALDAGLGLGFGRLALLFKVEVPLAFPLIWAGIRTSVVVNVGTATLGATIGAGGLGAPIVSGLVTQNYAFLWEGSLTAGLLALVVDAWFSVWEKPVWRNR